MLILFIVIGLVLLRVYQPELKSFARAQLKSVIVGGIYTSDVTLSLWTHFPSGAIVFHDFKVNGSNPNDTVPMITAKKLSLSFNWMDLISKNLSMKKIKLSDGQLRIRIDTGYNGNFNIFSTGDSTSVKTEPKVERKIINIDQISFENFRGSFEQNTLNHILIKANLNDFYIKGLVTNRNIYFSTKGKLDSFFILINKKQEYFNESVGLKTYAIRNKKSVTFRVKDFNITIDNNFFTGNMIITKPFDYGCLMDLNFYGHDLRWKNIKKSMPGELKKQTDPVTLDGNINLYCHLLGPAGEAGRPLVNLMAYHKDGIFSHPLLKEKKGNLSFVFNLLNYVKKDNIITDVAIPRLKYSKGKNILVASIKYNDLDSPFISIRTKLEGDFNFFNNVYEHKYKIFYDGHIKASGKIDNLSIDNIQSDFPAEADIQLQNSHANPLPNKKQIRFDTIHISIKKPYQTDIFTSLKIGKSDLKINTKFDDRRVLKNIESFFNAHKSISIQSNYFEIKDFIQEIRKKEPKKLTLSALVNSLRNSNILLDVKRINFNDIYYQELKLKGDFGLYQFKIPYFYLKGYGGEIGANGMLYFKQNNTTHIEGNVNLNKIDVNNVLKSHQNFQQDFITDKILFGTTDAAIKTEFSTKEDFSLDFTSLKADVDFKIIHGALINFAPLQKIGRYIRSSAFAEVKFEPILNHITIDNSTVYIPKMSLNNTIANLSIMGTHKFENVMDYKVNVNATQFLFGRKLDIDTENVSVSNRGIKLDLVIKGSGRAPTIKYDKELLKQKIYNKFERSKENVKSLFRKKKGRS